ncbi:MAG: (d)CMP kinase [Lacibacter sp.]
METKKIIIAIDGWSSCGKSTLAKQLAKQLGYTYIDSGAMYRAITLFFLRNNVDWTNESEVSDALKKIQLRFESNPESGQSEILLNNENVEAYIRELNVAQKVSDVSTIKAVREYAVMQQQKMGEGKGIVMDGRDIGTTVFPNAELKIFMDADNSVRAERRYKEMQLKNPAVTIDEVKQNLETRDYIDSNREISPLKKANDAIVIDNTDLTPQGQLDLALSYVLHKLN